MAIYHFEAKVITRGTGRSVVAAAAYACSQNESEEYHHDIHTANIEINYNNIPKVFLEYLSVMTWEEFGQILYDKDVIEQRGKWLVAFDNQDIVKTKKQFSDYIDCVTKKIPNLPIKIINDSIFYRMKGTKRFVNVIVGETGKMIGGAGSNDILSSDEICLYFYGDFDESLQDKIVRYASTDDTRNLFQTVIAPVEQAINQHNRTYKK